MESSTGPRVPPRCAPKRGYSSRERDLREARCRGARSKIKRQQHPESSSRPAEGKRAYRWCATRDDSLATPPRPRRSRTSLCDSKLRCAVPHSVRPLVCAAAPANGVRARDRSDSRRGSRRSSRSSLPRLSQQRSQRPLLAQQPTWRTRELPPTRNRRPTWRTRQLLRPRSPARSTGRSPQQALRLRLRLCRSPCRLPV